MKNSHPLFQDNQQATTVLVDEDSADQFSFEHWQTRHVLNWLKGIDDSISSYIRLFTQNRIDGKKLNWLTDERLRRFGVNKEKLRRQILHGIDLLNYYVYDVRSENAQKLALQVCVSVQNLLNAISIATPVILSPSQAGRSLIVLNSVLLNVADLHEDVLRLIFWLDRFPFDDKKWFIEVRDQLALLIQEIVDCINDPNNPKFLSVPQLLVDKGHRIRDLGHEIIHCSDPNVLYTAYIQRVGIEFRSTTTGIHLITKIYAENANNLASRVHVGDEIIEISRQSVVGWRMKNVRRKWEAAVKCTAQGGHEIEITLSKRPRESWVPITLQKTAAAGRSISPTAMESAGRTAPAHNLNNNNSNTRGVNGLASDLQPRPPSVVQDFKRKTQADQFNRQDVQKCSGSRKQFEIGQFVTEMEANEDPAWCESQPDRPTSLQESGKARRGRSASFCSAAEHDALFGFAEEEPAYRSPSPAGRARSPTALILAEKRPIFRRASVWTESPPAVLRSPFDRLRQGAESNAWLLLLASWGDAVPHRPNGLGPSKHQQHARHVLRNGDAIEEEHEEAEPEELRLDLNNLETISDSEVEALHLKPSPADHLEWSAPAQEDITGYRFSRRVHLESSSSQTNSIESPLANIQQKITRFFHGADPDPSPSTSFSDKLDELLPQTPSSKVFASIFTNPPRARDSPQAQSPVPQPPPTIQFPAEEWASPSQSPTNMFNPMSASTTSVSKVVNMVTHRKSKLAPLAEPDDISDVDDERKVETLPRPAPKTVLNAPQKSLSTNDVASYAATSVRSMSKTPADRLTGRVLEGWIRTKIIPKDHKDHHHPKDKIPWTKSWAVLTKTHLMAYSDQDGHAPNMVMDLKRCHLKPTPALKSKKKHVFCICWAGGETCFAPFTQEDLNFWIQNLVDKIDCDEVHENDEDEEHLAVYVTDPSQTTEESEEEDSQATSISSKVSLLLPTRLFSRLSTRMSRRGRFSYRAPDPPKKEEKRATDT